MINRNPEQNPEYQRLIDTLFALNCYLRYNRYTVGFNNSGNMLMLRFGKRVLMTSNNVAHVADELERRLELKTRVMEEQS